MRRVVVTGIGMISPLACNAEESWKLIIDGKSAIRKITRFDPEILPVKIAAEVRSPEENGGFNPDDWVSGKDKKKMDAFILYGMAASIQAIRDAGWENPSEEEKERTGVMIGSGIGGLPAIERTTLELEEKGFKRVSPFFIPSSLINLISGNLSIMYDYRGPNHAVVTACATGAHAIGDAAKMISHNMVDVMIAGGAEGAICRVGMAGFAAARALSTNFNDTPEEASRPWDKDRDGFVMGEGSGIVVLEEYEHAKKRGAKIYGEILGYGLSGDAYHITAPHPSGRGAATAMKNALKDANIAPNYVRYINAHGTSTPLGDEIEVTAVKNIFGDHAYKLSMSSTKSSIGHLLGAAGSVESIFTLLAMRDNIAPPTLNLHNPSESCDIDLIPMVAKEMNIDYGMSNSFGFGGTNVSLLFKKI